MVPSQQILDFLCASVPLQDFTFDELRELIPKLNPQVLSFSPQSSVVEANAPATQLGIVLEGTLSAQRTTRTNNVYVYQTLAPGDLFGLFAVYSSPQTWPLSYITTTFCKVLLFSAQPLLERNGLRNPGFVAGQSVLEDLVNHHNKMIFREICRSASTTRGKLLTFFDLMNDKYKGAPFPFGMTKERFAEYLNVSRSQLFRELAQLRKENMLQIDKSNTVFCSRTSFIQITKIRMI